VKKHILHILFLFTLGLLMGLHPTRLSAQQIYPGDVDKNGQAENIDVLLIGLAFGSSGPERPVPGTDGKATEAAPDWEESFDFLGINYSYADTNGDGKVDELDLFAVNQNYGKGVGAYFPYEFEEATEVNAPPLVAIPNTESFLETEIERIRFDFELGADFAEIPNAYGVAFTFYFDSTYAKLDNFSFRVDDDSWFVDDTSSATDDVLQFQKVSDQNKGEVFFTIVRTTQTPVTGGGKIASASVVIEDIIIGAKEEALRFGVKDVFVIDTNYNNIPVVWEERDVINLTTVGTKKVNKKVQPVVQPNPAQEEFTFTLPDIAEKIERFLVFDMMGNQFMVHTEQIEPRSFNISTIGLAPGLYVVIAESSSELYSSKVLISQ
jgi:hypothetical protein